MIIVGRYPASDESYPALLDRDIDNCGNHNPHHAQHEKTTYTDLKTH